AVAIAGRAVVGGEVGVAGSHEGTIEGPGIAVLTSWSVDETITALGGGAIRVAVGTRSRDIGLGLHIDKLTGLSTCRVDVGVAAAGATAVRVAGIGAACCPLAIGRRPCSWITLLGGSERVVMHEANGERGVLHAVSAGRKGAVRVAVGCVGWRTARVVDAVAVFAGCLVASSVATANCAAIGVAGRAVGLRAPLVAGCSRSR